MVGKRFDGYRCDEFHFRPAIYQLVGISVDGNVFAIENIIKPTDFFESIEDVGCISVTPIPCLPVQSRVKNGILVDTPVDEVIENIIVIEDTETMYCGDTDLYDFSYTKALVFVLPTRQIVFEKDVWFSEDIFIYKGPNAVEKIMSPESEAEESDQYSFRIERKETSLLNSIA
ncbi:MAG: hypothetical protein ACOYIK_05280 [Coriobacteriales bacterium]|jgi:hypothetical protein